MLLIQLTGLSGAGKSTLASRVKAMLEEKEIAVEILDGDAYRKNLFKELGFSAADRKENIRRLGYLAQVLLRHRIIVLLAAINPYEETRNELSEYGPHVKTVFLDCDLQTLEERDTKGLYKKAKLPGGHPDKVYHLTGVDDPYERPLSADLVINTAVEGEKESALKLLQFIMQELQNLEDRTPGNAPVNEHFIK